MKITSLDFQSERTIADDHCAVIFTPEGGMRFVMPEGVTDGDSVPEFAFNLGLCRMAVLHPLVRQLAMKAMEIDFDEDSEGGDA